MEKLKILNCYCGIGGNRKLWDGDIEVTAIENNKEIAKIYQDFFPEDKVIVTDAHQYLLEHYKEFDFIWSSPPCPSHSRLRKGFSCNVGAKPVYPDMQLYQEILFLEGYFKGKWVVENVIPFYESLIAPSAIMDRHYYWSNFNISIIDVEKEIKRLIAGSVGFDFITDKYVAILELEKKEARKALGDENKEYFKLL